MLRVYKSPATPGEVLVPEAQAEQILCNDTDLLKPEDVFAALLSVPEQHTLGLVVLLDERDEYARKETHPKWPPAHKSFGGGGQVCFHGVSKRDDPVAILNYHWAKEQIIYSSLRWLNQLATEVELNRSWLSSEALYVDCAAHMAGDILVKESDAFEAFAARAPLRTLALCRGLRAAESFSPFGEWLAQREHICRWMEKKQSDQSIAALWRGGGFPVVGGSHDASLRESNLRPKEYGPAYTFNFSRGG